MGTRTITLCPLCTKFPSIRTALKTSSAGHLLLLTSRGKTIRSRHRRWQQFKQSQVRFIFCWNWIKYKCQTKWCMWKQPPLLNATYCACQIAHTKGSSFNAPSVLAQKSTFQHFPMLNIQQCCNTLLYHISKLPVLPLGLLWVGSLSPDKNCRLKMKSYILSPGLSLHLLAALLQPSIRVRIKMGKVLKEYLIWAGKGADHLIAGGKVRHHLEIGFSKEVKWDNL